MLLADEEWATWGDREIARQCNVGHKFVGKLKGEFILAPGASMPTERKFTHPKTGTVSTMRTDNIGRRAT